MILFFDIETISSFSKRERKSKNFLSLKEKHGERFNFMPEFNKILTIAVGYYTGDTVTVKNLLGTEQDQIRAFFEYVKLYQISGYNIKGFDIPFIVKRAMKYNISIPNQLKASNKKPWEFENIIDLYDIWKHIGYNACSLDVLCNFLSIPSSKDGIDGSQVQEFYDSKREAEIIAYCIRDVEATIRIYQKFKELNFI